MDCVVCSSPETLHLTTVRPSISTDRQIFDVAVENRLCETCGTIFNAGGARDHGAELYSEPYDLHGESALSEWQVHFENNPRGESSAILDFVEGAAPLAASGSVLEIGCGKGILLGELSRRHPDWSLHGVEPSSNATAYFQQVLPAAEIHEGLFESSPFQDRTFDFVAVSRALEHVPDPVGFLRRVRSSVAPGGCVYVGVPNFEVKPDDLLVYDHLTRLTPVSLDELYRRAGFEVVAREAPSDRVRLWDVLRPSSSELPADPAVDPARVAETREMCSRHAAFIRRAQMSFAEMLDELGEFEFGALFGLGVLGVLELFRCGRRGRGVRYILDDNPRLWGSVKHGREVYGSETVPQLALSKVFLAANPCYHDRMRSKLLALGMAPDDVYG